MTPKNNKRKEKVLQPKVKLLEHIDFHSSFELNGDVNFFDSSFESTKKKKREQINPRASKSEQVYQNT